MLFKIFQENLRKLDYVKPRNNLAVRGKLLQGKTDRLVINNKWIDLRHQPLFSKSANANVGIKISRDFIFQRLYEINFNSRVAFTQSYISKKNKMS